MTKISIIAAKSKNNVIGKNNQLPWRLPNDLKNFKSLTQNNIVVMGRKTYESIGKPLPNRLNVVISSQNNLNLPAEVLVLNSPREALKATKSMAIKHNIKNIYVIGGAGIYQQFINDADKLILTTIDEDCEGDTFFPFFKKELWELKHSDKHYDESGYMLYYPHILGLTYTIEEYERIF